MSLLLQHGQSTGTHLGGDGRAAVLHDAQLVLQDRARASAHIGHERAGQADLLPGQHRVRRGRVPGQHRAGRQTVLHEGASQQHADRQETPHVVRTSSRISTVWNVRD